MGLSREGVFGAGWAWLQLASAKTASAGPWLLGFSVVALARGLGLGSWGSEEPLPRPSVLLCLPSF